MRRVFVTAGLSALLAFGCDAGDGEASGSEPTPTPDAGRPADQGVDTTPLRVRLTNALPMNAPRARLQLLVEGVDVDFHRVDPVPPFDVWPVDVEVEPVPPGTYRLVVFQDRNGDEVFDGCPFPPDPGHTAAADEFDNVHGVYEGPVGGDDAIGVVVERHICGPGEAATGLRGRVVPPEGGELDGVAIHLMLTPLADRRLAPDDEDEMHGAPMPLQVPLLPRGLTEAVDFEVGELVPGEYQLVLYADEDEDGKPTLCGPGLGGGDRHVATIQRFEIVAGERRALPTELLLAQPEGCPDALTGVHGTLRLDVALVGQHAEDPALTEPLGLLAGPVRLALFDETDQAVESVEILPGLDGKAHGFTVSGLPAGVWRLAVWLDRDDDGQFAPCGGLPAGLDTVYVQLDDVEVRDGELVDAGEVVLSQGECDPGVVSGVRGRLSAPSEEGSVGSGRPVRLELYPVAEGAERRSLLLFENHHALPADEAPFVSIDVPPGAYQGRIYLDTDRDGDFTSCLDAPFGDRATTEIFHVDVVEGGLIDLGSHAPVLLGCDVPDTGLLPEVVGDALVDDEHAVGPLRLWIEEAGGWAEDRQLRRRFEPDGDAVATPRISLAPGSYRVVAYVDVDDDAHYTACGEHEGAPADGYAASVEIVLDEQGREARPELLLARVCR